MGQSGLYLGRLVRIDGPFDPQFLITEPSFRGLIPVSDYPDLGSMGVRSGIDQSDLVWTSGLLCRNLTDFPTFRCNFKNIDQMLSRVGGCAVSSLDMGEILSRSGSDACILAIPSDLGKLSREAMKDALGSFAFNETWDPSCSQGKRVEYENHDADKRLAVLDLGIRAGLLRYLRDRVDVVLLPPKPPFGDIEHDFDLVLISGGPGSHPGPELPRIVGDFMTSCGRLPVFAMGIGALALNMVHGGHPSRMERPHRSFSIEVRMGDILLPTYQNHECSLDPSPGYKVELKAHDGTIEMVSREDGRVRLCLFDTLPEFGTIPEDPLENFLGADR